MNMVPRVSIVFVNYNSISYLVSCIQSIFTQTLVTPFEIIVVDNASSEDVNSLTEIFPTVQLLINTSNLGFAVAANQGMALSKGEYILFLNPDTILLNNVLDIFVSEMDLPEHSKVACCGGDFFNETGEKQVAFGNFPSLCEAFSSLGFAKLYPTYFKGHLSSAVINQSLIKREVNYVSGANLFIRAELVKHFNGFDEDFFLYFEETELCHRLHKNGFATLFLPDAKLMHVESGSFKLEKADEPSLQKTRFFEASRYLYFKKVYGKPVAKLVRRLYLVRALLLYRLKSDQNYSAIAKIIRQQIHEF